jgi:hypothetical protein
LFSLSIISSLVNFWTLINVLKRTYETEIQSASFYQTPAIRESIVKKWEYIKIILV